MFISTTFICYASFAHYLFIDLRLLFNSFVSLKLFYCDNVYQFKPIRLIRV